MQQQRFKQRKCEMVQKKGGWWKENYRFNHQLQVQCLFSQSFRVKADCKTKESCDWRDGRREVRFIRLLLEEWTSREKRHAMEDWMALKYIYIYIKGNKEGLRKGEKRKREKETEWGRKNRNWKGEKARTGMWQALFVWGKNTANTVWIPYCFLCFSHVWVSVRVCVCMHDSAHVRECATDHITPSEDLGLTSGGQALTPLLSLPTHHLLTHIFSHSHWRTSIKATKACTLRSAPAVIGLLAVPLKHV